MTRDGTTLASLFAANGRHGPSFDMIRLFAALMVVLSHSLMVTRDHSGAGWLLTHIWFGRLGVLIFFMLSGYLVTESFRRDPDLWRFLRKRALRIYPALIVLILLLAFVLGPAMTSLSWGEYFSGRSTWAFLANAIAPFRYDLPGVFLDNRETGVDGSLWTIRFELICYLGLAFFGAALLARRWLLLGLTLATLAASAFIDVESVLHAYHGFVMVQLAKGAQVTASFLAGATVCAFSDRLSVDRRWIAAASIVALAGYVLLRFELIFPLVVAYLIAVLGNTRLLAFASLRRGVLAGDFSYGLYIVAFPVQQVVVSTIGQSCPWWLCLLVATPIAFVLAMLSWHFVEKPSLRLKYASPLVPGFA